MLPSKDRDDTLSQKENVFRGIFEEGSLKETFSELFCNFLVKTALCKSFFCFFFEKHIIVPNSNGKTFQANWKVFQISILYYSVQRLLQIKHLSKPSA